MAEAATLVRRGRAWSFGNDISTDLIMPGAILWGHVKGADARKAAIMPNRPGWAERDARPGDLVVAGTNFGCGSSRPAPRVLRDELGLSCVVAESFSRLFQRNAVNIGFPVLICPGITTFAAEGDELEVHFDSGLVRNETPGRRAVRRALPARQPARPAAADGRPAPVPRAVARRPPRGPRDDLSTFCVTAQVPGDLCGDTEGSGLPQAPQRGVLGERVGEGVGPAGRGGRRRRGGSRGCDARGRWCCRRCCGRAGSGPAADRRGGRAAAVPGRRGRAGRAGRHAR